MTGLPDVRWVVVLDRADAWPDWRWLDRLTIFNREFVGALGVLPLLLNVLVLPSVAVRSLGYRLRHRADWDVLVFRYRGALGPHRSWAADRRETYPTRRAAAARAEALIDQLERTDHLPD